MIEYFLGAPVGAREFKILITSHHIPSQDNKKIKANINIHVHTKSKTKTYTNMSHFYFSL